jgi:DNA-binding protein YbaB
MVRVEATGQQNLTAFHIDPSLLESPDRELLEELLLSASNQALEKARTAAADELSKITGGFDIPGLSNALGLGGAGNTVPE